MYIFRDTFIAKPGYASKLARLMKEAMSDRKVRVMTDLVSDYNQIVVESEMEHLADFEKDMNEYKTNTNPDMAAKMAGYHDMYYKGKREIFQIVD